MVYLLGGERRYDFSPKSSEIHIPRGYYSVEYVSKEINYLVLRSASNKVKKYMDS